MKDKLKVPVPSLIQGLEALKCQAEAMNNDSGTEQAFFTTDL